MDFRRSYNMDQQVSMHAHDKDQIFLHKQMNIMKGTNRHISRIHANGRYCNLLVDRHNMRNEVLFLITSKNVCCRVT